MNWYVFVSFLFPDDKTESIEFYLRRFSSPRLISILFGTKLMIVTVLIRYKSWQSQIRFLFECFSFLLFVVSFLSAVSHYAHKLHEIYLLSALEAHEGTNRDIFLFIKLFISEMFFFSHRNIFPLYFSPLPWNSLWSRKIEMYAIF